jgi:hypothetical protein
MKSQLTLWAVAALLPLSLTAQGSKKMVPNPGAQDGNGSAYYFSVYEAGRSQQITLGSALCNSSSVILELAMRADGGNMGALPVRSYKTINVSIGYTSNTPANMSKTFATNRTGTQTQVFSGSYSLPAQNTTTRPFNIRWKLAKPFIYTRNQGNLLIEYEVPITATTKFSYFFDAHKQSTTSGSSYNFGTAGSFSAKEKYLFHAGNNADLKPGGKAEMVLQPFSKQYAALSIWGFSKDKWGAITLPLSLAGLGATQNFLNVSPDLIFGMPMTAVTGGFEGRAALPIPSNKIFMGKSLFTQAVFLDLAANKAGLVFTRGLAMTLMNDQPPAQLLGSYDYKAATGQMPVVGEGIVFEFTGSFN